MDMTWHGIAWHGMYRPISEMNEECLPEDLIKEYAAEHPKQQGVTQTQKVFCLAMMMRQDKIEPFEETYRWVGGGAKYE